MFTGSVSQSAYGTPTGPTAGTALASLTLAPGSYDVFVASYLTGTTSGTDADNIGLYSDGALVATILTPSTVNTMLPAQEFIVRTTTGSIQLKAIANAGASALYHVSLTAAGVAAR